MAIQIHNATLSDLARLADFFVTEQGEHIAAHPKLFAPVDRAAVTHFLADLLDSDSCYLRVAKQGAAICGFSLLEIYHHPGSLIRLPRRFAYIELIAVDLEHRRRGIGSALLTDAKALAGSLGINRVELDVMAFNDGARQFYASQGFTGLSYRLCAEGTSR